MQFWKRDKDGKLITDKDTGQYALTPAGVKALIVFLLVFIPVCLAPLWLEMSQTICPGCGKEIIEGVGINDDGILVDGGAAYHNFGCQLEEATRIFQEGVNEQARILEKQKRLKSGE